MAIVNELHDTTSLEAALVKLPEIDAALLSAQMQFESNFYWLDILENPSFDVLGDLNSTSTHLSYQGLISLYDWYGFWLEDVEVDLDISGSGLPVYDQNLEIWSNATSPRVTGIDVTLPELNNAVMSFDGSINYGATSSTFNLASFTFGDDNLKLTVTGDLTLTQYADSAKNTASGSITSLQFDLLNDPDAAIAGNESHFIVDAAVKVTSSAALITSFSLIEESAEGTETVLLEASKLSLDFDDLATRTGDFLVAVLLAGNDSITGTSGDDTLQGGAGKDSIDGGDGTDTVVYALNWSDYEIKEVDAGFTVKALSGSEGLDTVSNVEYYQFADQVLSSGQVTGEGGETIIGGDGDDTLEGGNGGDTVEGGAGADTVDGGAGDDTIEGGAGDDVIDGGTGEDTVLGGDGDDTIDAGEDNDVVEGDAGDDELDGGSGNDSVFGGSGTDVLDGGTGKDRMEGGTGADSYYVDNKKDVVFEANNDPEDGSGLVLDVDLGSTIDSVISSVKYTLSNYVENLTLAESTAKLAGTGNTLGNVIIGNAGANKISGMDGADTIDGGEGVDKLAGGDGADSFRFTNIASGGADAVSDFADEDSILFDTTVFTGLTGAAADSFVLGTAAVAAEDRLIYSDKGGLLYYDADGVGGTAAVKIVAIKGADAKSIDFSDFSFV